MAMDNFLCQPIGIIHSEHQNPEQTPIQPVYAADCLGTVEVFPEYAAGLADLDGFSHIYLLYRFHRVQAVRLRVKPFLQDVERGIFATRASCRPNQIGFSVVRLLKVDNNLLQIAGVDILDGAPLLDIKPYVSRFDHLATTRNGWQDQVDETTAHQRGTRAEQK